MTRLRRFLPILDWLPAYRRDDLPGDLLAGIIVTIMLVPQGMAYAMLADLPPQVGLYAAILPLFVYSLFGTSRTLAVGPVAVVSLMVASAAGTIALPGTADHLGAALVLALLSGLLLIAMGVARLGFLTNYLSHPVLAGFITAAAVLIGLSQVRHLIGVPLDGNRLDQVALQVVARFGEINWMTFALGVGAIVLMLWMKGPMGGLLRRLGARPAAVTIATKTGPLAAVVLTSLLVWAFALDETAAVRIVGDIPTGLPGLSLPPADIALWRDLAVAAALIGIVGFLESVSVAKSLAAKRRQKVDPDQELIGLGAANVTAAFSGAYPVTGGFSRSIVNFSAGANTPLAGILTAGLIAIVVSFFTPVMYFLPSAALAAIIIVAVAGLIDFKAIRHIWHYNKADGTSLAVTGLVVLVFGIEAGIAAGAGLSLALFLWRTSRPHMAIVGRVPGSEHYRNVERHSVITSPRVLAVRVDESLYFPNAAYLEDKLLAMVAERPEIDHLVLICSAVNFIDASALETLEALIERLSDAGVTLHLAEVKGPVMDGLETVDFVRHLRGGSVFLSTQDAMRVLAPEVCRERQAAQ